MQGFLRTYADAPELDGRIKYDRLAAMLRTTP